MAPCEGLSLGTPHVLLDTACAKYALSKTLGYGIVVGSAGVKLPQVFAILKSGGVSGLSSASILIEMASLVSSFSYYMALGYPFSTWGENFFLFFQHSIITACYLHYTHGLMSLRSLGTVLPLAALGVVLYRRAVPDFALPSVFSALLGLSDGHVVTCQQLAGMLPVLLAFVGRLPQIAQNMRQGHTGQLSLITYALNVAGSGARAFTVMQELDDKLALTSAISSFLQNAILVAQILLLGSGGGSQGKATKATSKRPKKAE